MSANIAFIKKQVETKIDIAYGHVTNKNYLKAEDTRKGLVGILGRYPHPGLPEIINHLENARWNSIEKLDASSKKAYKMLDNLLRSY